MPHEDPLVLDHEGQRFLSVATFGAKPSTTFAASSSVIPLKTSIGTWELFCQIFNTGSPFPAGNDKLQKRKQHEFQPL
nr:hypothetical protein Iba_chr08dCG9070 [Ipomoea batatas]